MGANIKKKCRSQKIKQHFSIFILDTLKILVKIIDRFYRDV